jgi:hypothetical protein
LDAAVGVAMVPAGIDNNSIVVAQDVVVTCNQRLFGNHLNEENKSGWIALFIATYALYSVDN